MQSIGEIMKFKPAVKGGETINPYVQTYERMKRAGKVKTAVDTQYTCEKCEDTGYVTVLDADGNFSKAPCKCLAKIQTEARLRKSGISLAEYAKYSFAKFKTDTREHASMKKIAERYIQDRAAGQGIGFFGASGTGKTHICIAICQALTCDYSEEHYYFSYRSEIQKIKAVMYSNAELYSQAIQHWTGVNNLYIDDLFKFAMKDGKIQQQDLQIMFDIINTRYINHKTTLFSSEYSLSYITNNIDEALGSRIKSMLGDYGLKCIGANARLEKGA
ncbi:DnaA ATPase domain-containing protein [Pectinatus haikarae]|uniref:DNA replication protein DnaC n=1 Tax=Pectinatus haikarae TaxID=349096 RepID=A0ABT9YAF8_9FIRM|nr:DnaA/Hda family protein [Pectinatus haikarae]MDQ0204089.1 DNA replication protein DnaC [Pectinatus haikarae]